MTDIETLLDEAKIRGVFLGSLAVAGGLEKLDPETGDAVAKIVRAITLAAVGMRMADLADNGASERDQVEYKALAMHAFDVIMTGWLERCRHRSALN